MNRIAGTLLACLYGGCAGASEGTDIQPTDQAKVLDSVMVWGRGISGIGVDLSAS